MIHYSIEDFNGDVKELAKYIRQNCRKSQGGPLKYSSVFAVPRGGYMLGLALSKELNLPLADSCRRSSLIVDDVIDSGTTRMRFPEHDFLAIHSKIDRWEPSDALTYAIHRTKDWIHYFWEGEAKESSIEDSVIRQLQYIGEDPKREGLIDTPKRVINSYGELFKGYKQDPKEVLTTFDGEGYDEMVLLKDIELYSMCEHHMLPFIGKCHIAYIPDKKVIGISKLARLLEIFSRRLQIQERLTSQITKALMEHLEPLGVACVIEAEHLCMRMRGISKQNSFMVTSSLTGVFKENQATRTEFMGLIK